MGNALRNCRRMPDPSKLRLKMACLCSRSEQCTYDIYLKLRKAGLSDSSAAEIINFLIKENFISDERFARAFANDKVKFSGWGKYKIRMALIAKRIPSKLISQALDNIDDRIYIDTLLRIAKAKADTLDISTVEGKQKLYRHILSRGFESEMVSAIIKKLRS